MRNTVLKENVHWVGYIDWDVREFHGYRTSRGSTYNSYLIIDEKNALIDSVKAPYYSYLEKHIQEHIPVTQIDYVICNHAEPDHSGSIPELMKKCTKAELVCNEKCRKALSMHYDTSSWKFKIIDESSVLCLGNHSLKFINTPMAHWPESMATYIPKDKIFFSMDGFGQHYASSGRFDYEENLIDVLYEAKKYYANIVMLYGKPIQAVLEKASVLNIELIAPSHGVMWRRNIPEILECYNKWIHCKAEKKVLIIFDTMWRSTAMMADAMFEGAVHESDVEVRKFDLKYTNITDIATEVLDAAVIAIGTPTLNKTLTPKAAEILTYLKGLAPADKYALAFGSYGWAKKSGQHDALEYLKQMQCKLLYDEPIQSQFVPGNDVLEKCREAGRLMARTAASV